MKKRSQAANSLLHSSDDFIVIEWDDSKSDVSKAGLASESTTNLNLATSSDFVVIENDASKSDVSKASSASESTTNLVLSTSSMITHFGAENLTYQENWKGIKIRSNSAEEVKNLIAGLSGVPDALLERLTKPGVLQERVELIGTNFQIKGKAEIKYDSTVMTIDLFVDKQADKLEIRFDERLQKQITIHVQEMLVNSYLPWRTVSGLFEEKSLERKPAFINLELLCTIKLKERSPSDSAAKNDEDVKQAGRSERLSRFENLFSDRRSLKINNLFKPNSELFTLNELGKEEHEKLSTRSPKTLLVHGSAGIGKTTLAKYISQSWALGRQSLQPQNHQNDDDDNDKEVPRSAIQEELTFNFEWVFTLFLRELSQSQYQQRKQLTLREWIYKSRFAVLDVEEAEFKWLWKEKIESALLQGKGLIILEGYDELPNEHDCQEVIDSLNKGALSKIPKLITSRPHVAHSIQSDRNIELIGFTNISIERYVEMYFNDDPKYHKAVVELLHNQKNLWSSAHIPILLNIMCWILKDKKDYQRVDGRLVLPVAFETMTGLYEVMFMKLLARGYEAEKRENPQLTELNVSESHRREQLLQHYKKSLKCLFTIAYQGISESETMLISNKCFEKALRECGVTEEDFNSVTKQLYRLGLLRPVLTDAQGNPLTGSRQSYEFLHLTFQEFFAAHYWVRLYISTNNNIDRDKAINIFRRDKCDPRFQIIWPFVSGLLASDPSFSFINTWLSNQVDILGWYDLTLLIRCIEQMGDKINSLYKSHSTIRSLLHQVFSFLQSDFVISYGRSIPPHITNLITTLQHCPQVVLECLESFMLNRLQIYEHRYVWTDGSFELMKCFTIMSTARPFLKKYITALFWNLMNGERGPYKDDYNFFGFSHLTWTKFSADTFSELFAEIEKSVKITGENNSGLRYKENYYEELLAFIPWKDLAEPIVCHILPQMVRLVSYNNCRLGILQSIAKLTLMQLPSEMRNKEIFHLVNSVNKIQTLTVEEIRGLNKIFTQDLVDAFISEFDDTEISKIINKFQRILPSSLYRREFQRIDPEQSNEILDDTLLLGKLNSMDKQQQFDYLCDMYRHNRHGCESTKLAERAVELLLDKKNIWYSRDLIHGMKWRIGQQLQAKIVAHFESHFSKNQSPGISTTKNKDSESVDIELAYLMEEITFHISLQERLARVIIGILSKEQCNRGIREYCTFAIGRLDYEILYESNPELVESVLNLMLIEIRKYREAKGFPYDNAGYPLDYDDVVARRSLTVIKSLFTAPNWCASTNRLNEVLDEVLKALASRDEYMRDESSAILFDHFNYLKNRNLPPLKIIFDKFIEQLDKSQDNDGIFEDGAKIPWSKLNLEIQRTYLKKLLEWIKKGRDSVKIEKLLFHCPIKEMISVLSQANPLKEALELSYWVLANHGLPLYQVKSEKSGILEWSIINDEGNIVILPESCNALLTQVLANCYENTYFSEKMVLPHYSQNSQSSALVRSASSVAPHSSLFGVISSSSASSTTAVKGGNEKAITTDKNEIKQTVNTGVAENNKGKASQNTRSSIK